MPYPKVVSNVERGGVVTTYVMYQVPVWVKVDPDEGRVLDVNVADEFIEGPGDVHDETGADVSGSERERALAIAEEQSWPLWTIGP